GSGPDVVPSTFSPRAAAVRVRYSAAIKLFADPCKQTKATIVDLLIENILLRASWIDEFTIAFALPHHFLAISIERVVDDPLGGIQRVVVFVSETTKAIG